MASTNLSREQLETLWGKTLDLGESALKLGDALRNDDLAAALVNTLIMQTHYNALVRDVASSLETSLQGNEPQAPDVNMSPDAFRNTGVMDHYFTPDGRWIGP